MLACCPSTMAGASSAEGASVDTITSMTAASNRVEALRAAVGGDDGPTATRLRAGGEAFDEGTLRRWLTAKRNNVQEAARELAQHAVWRSGFVPKGRITKVDVADRLKEKVVYLQGRDKESRPVVYIIGSNIVMRFWPDNEALKRFLCFVLDTAIQSMEPEQQSCGKITVVFDLSGFGMSNADPHILPTMFSLLESHYPERLAQAIIYNAPTIFYGLWQAAQSFVHPVTSKKILFLDGPAGVSEVHKRISPEMLPASLGGSGTLVPVEKLSKC